MKDDNTSNDNLEVLSTRCHKLKSLSLTGVNFLGLDKLLASNRNLVSIKLLLNDDLNNTSIGAIFEILGQYCPLIQNCELENFGNHATDIQICTFTKGYTNLKSLTIRYECRFYHKVLHYLGRYSAVLEKFLLWNCTQDSNENNNSLTTEQTNCLQSLSNGCP